MTPTDKIRFDDHERALVNTAALLTLRADRLRREGDLGAALQLERDAGRCAADVKRIRILRSLLVSNVGPQPIPGSTFHRAERSA